MRRKRLQWRENPLDAIQWKDATWIENSFYAVLGVTPTAAAETIRRAYLGLAARYHPDQVPEHVRQEATDRMVDVNQAYEVLGDPKRRAAYDKALKIK